MSKVENIVRDTRGFLAMLGASVILATIFYFLNKNYIPAAVATDIINSFHDKDIYLGFFGTVVQGFIGLAALLLAITVFRLQQMDQEIQSYAQTLRNHMSGYQGDVVVSVAIDKIDQARLVDAVADVLQHDAIIPGYALAQLRGYARSIQIGLESQDKVRQNMTRFSSVTFILIIIAMLGIPFSPAIASHYVFGLYAMAMLQGGCVAVLYVAWQLICSLLKFRFDEPLS